MGGMETVDVGMFKQTCAGKSSSKRDRWKKKMSAPTQRRERYYLQHKNRANIKEGEELQREEEGRTGKAAG